MLAKFTSSYGYESTHTHMHTRMHTRMHTQTHTHTHSSGKKGPSIEKAKSVYLL